MWIEILVRNFFDKDDLYETGKSYKVDKEKGKYFIGMGWAKETTEEKKEKEPKK